jgi:ribonucleoside-diphosphate reductase beta chain
VSRTDIFSKRDAYKPFKYPWAYDLWLEHEQMHWVSKEVTLHEDVRDWNNKLTTDDREFLSDVFLLFTQGDIDVADGYIRNYLPHFKHPEVRMMLLGFAAREATHIDAYSHLIETLGKTDDFYTEFLEIPVMKEKHDFFEQFVDTCDGENDLPLQIAAISAFTEGMFLFSSFVMLLNYPRNSLMKGMGQIVTWSILDEQKHVEGLLQLFTTVIQENESLWTPTLERTLYDTAEIMTGMEEDFIDYVFDSHSAVHNLSKTDLKQYIKYIVDRRLITMGLKGLHKVKENPLPWVDEMIASQNHENFFENRPTSYAKGALEGSWGDVWGQYE